MAEGRPGSVGHTFRPSLLPSCGFKANGGKGVLASNHPSPSDIDLDRVKDKEGDLYE